MPHQERPLVLAWRAGFHNLDPDDDESGGGGTGGNADFVAIGVGDGVAAGDAGAAVADVYAGVEDDVVRPVGGAGRLARAVEVGDEAAREVGCRRQGRPERAVDVARRRQQGG